MILTSRTGQLGIFVLLLAACGSDEVSEASPASVEPSVEKGSGGAPSETASPTPSNVSQPEVSQPNVPQPSTNLATTDSPSLPNEGSGANQIPCDVAEIVGEHCATCHGATPKFNAPMALMTVSDFAANAPVSGQPSHAASSARIHLSGAGQMPPVGTVDALEPEELETLTAWLDAGAKPVESGCEVSEPGASTDGEVLPRPTKPGAFQKPYEGWDEGVTCYPFVTFDPTVPDKSEPYKVGIANDKYVGFGFKPPWEGTRYWRAFKSVTDNAQVLHHWLLFQEPVPDGSVAEIAGAHPAGQMMNGWAPGGSDMYFTPQLGMKMDGNQTFLLEVHYNSTDLNARDASGVEICVTEEKPEEEAIIHWLGTDNIVGTTSSGVCAPRSTEPIHIISATPHMHLKGKHMKVELTRQDGSQEILHDEPFSFENQRGYSKDIVINPGDSIKTTCDWSAPSTFGKGTNEEMCYWFTLAYPAGALSDGMPLGTLFHGPTACLGL